MPFVASPNGFMTQIVRYAASVKVGAGETALDLPMIQSLMQQSHVADGPSGDFSAAHLVAPHDLMAPHHHRGARHET